MTTRMVAFILVVLALLATPLIDSYISTVEQSFTEQELDHTMQHSVYASTDNTAKQVQLLDNASGHSVGWEPDGIRKLFKINEKNLTDSSAITTTINLVPVSHFKVPANCFDIKGIAGLFPQVWILDDFCTVGHARLFLLDVRENTIRQSDLVLGLRESRLNWLIDGGGYVCCDSGKLKQVSPGFRVVESTVNVVNPFGSCSGTMSHPLFGGVLIPDKCDNMVSVVETVPFLNLTTRIPVGIHPIKVSSEWVGSEIYTLNEGPTPREARNENLSLTNGTVSVINGTSNQLMKTIEVDQIPSDFVIDFSNNNMIYVSYGIDSAANGTISVINGTSNQLTDTVEVGKNARHLAINPNTRTIYAISEDITGNDVISVINGTSNQLARTISFGEQAVLGEMTINPNTNMIYVIDKFSNDGADSVAIINGTSNEVLEKIPVGSQASDMFINKKEDKVYLKSQVESSWLVSIIDGHTRSIRT